MPRPKSGHEWTSMRLPTTLRDELKRMAQGKPLWLVVYAHIINPTPAPMRQPRGKPARTG
jgi:hypothetical protein